MKYYLDTEFIEEPGRLDLISIGIVNNQGKEFYRESNEVDWSRSNDWVNTYVKPQLEGKGVSKHQIALDVLEYIGDDPKVQFWGYYSDYDWVIFCWLFGAMIALPKNFPMYCLDVKQELVRVGNPKIQIAQEKDHHALSDAKWIRELHFRLSEMENV